MNNLKILLDDSFGDTNSFARLVSDIAKNNPGIKIMVYTEDEEIKKENLIKLLSKREKEILKLLSKGLKNKEIADQLCISHYTIEKHKTNIRKKFGLKSSTELTVFAARNFPDES